MTMQIKVNLRNHSSKLDQLSYHDDMLTEILNHEPELDLRRLTIEDNNVDSYMDVTFDTPVMYLQFEVTVNQTEVDRGIVMNITPNVHLATIRNDVVKATKEWNESQLKRRIKK